MQPSHSLSWRRHIITDLLFLSVGVKLVCHACCKQERERKERERVVRAKVAASAFARGYLNGIIGSVFQTLHDTGGMSVEVWRVQG